MYSASGREDQDPPEEAYGRVTGAERFRPLHSATLQLIGRLEAAFDVERVEGYGLDEELESPVDLARPSIRLSPADPAAAPITVAFSDFPGLRVRFGRWNTELFPNCGCDACGGSAKEEIELLTEMVDSVAAGGFREAVQHPMVPFIGSCWLEMEFRSSVSMRSGRSRIDGALANRMSGGQRRLELDWKPWPRRQAPAGQHVLYCEC